MIKDIIEVAKNFNIPADYLISYGKYKAKIDLKILERTNKNARGKYIVITAMTPTPLGEGKTLNAIGLSMGLNKLNRKSFCILRQPSMGLAFGIKGGGVGSGKSFLFPEDEINFHFTGDFHAVTYAHNLITAVIYNSLYFGNSHKFRNLEWHRILDINDRSLRNIHISSEKINIQFAKSRFDITPSSEIMAILALATDYTDLYDRIKNIILGFSENSNPIHLKEFNIQDSVIGILKDAFLPNLVQTCEGTPAILHTGPFGNIAHGSSSIVADYIGLNYSDYVVTESGFGSECGYEKFVDIKCRTSGLIPNLACIVGNLRAIKFQSGKFGKKDLHDKIYQPNAEAIEQGLPNLLHHINNVKITGIPYLVLINKFPLDKNEEIEYLIKLLRENNIYQYSVIDCYNSGSEGAIDAAGKAMEIAESSPRLNLTYDLSDTIKNKFFAISKNFYNSSNIKIEEDANNKIEMLSQQRLSNIAVCVAKTQFSISCNPKAFGAPKDEPSIVKDVRIFNGARFIVLLTENIETMPGLSKEPLIYRYKFDFEKRKLYLP